MADSITTWADEHPEVAESFARDPIPWHCEQIDAHPGPVVQPCMAMGPGEELFASGHLGHVFNSVDQGKSWGLLCEAPPLHPPLPVGSELSYHPVQGGVTIGGCEIGGIGVSREGTLLLVWNMRYSFDDLVLSTTWVTRSEDHGVTWEAASPFDPAPRQRVSANQGNVLQLASGRLIAQALAPDAESKDLWVQVLYASDDDGRSWRRLSHIEQAAEPHLFELEPGRLLAAIRYQRQKTADDPANLATGFTRELWMDFAHAEDSWEDPTDVGVRVCQGTFLTSSDDGGVSWSRPRMVTGLLQQSASLVRLADGVLVLTFGRPGQRFMLSYDDGVTWSKAVYQLHDDGEYARAAALSDDTIVVVHDFGHYMWHRRDDVRLGVLRFRVPPRVEVEKLGFFAPRELQG